MRTFMMLFLVVSCLPACAVEDPELLTGVAPAELGIEAAEITPVRSFPSAIHGMAVTDTGRLYVTDSFGRMGSSKRSLYYVDPPYTGSFTATRVSGTIPAGLMFDGGLLYICDVSTGIVRGVDSDHRVRKAWFGVTQPWNITRLSDGTLLTVSNAGIVQRLEDDGSVTTLFGGLDTPFGIASAGDGTVWISEQGATAPGRVTRRTLAGEVVESIAYGWDNPEGLHVDGAGDLWIAETSLGQILRYDGAALTVEGAGLGLPVVITGVDGDSLLANSANLPPRLLSIEIQP